MSYRPSSESERAIFPCPRWSKGRSLGDLVVLLFLRWSSYLFNSHLRVLYILILGNTLPAFL